MTNTAAQTLLRGFARSLLLVAGGLLLLAALLAVVQYHAERRRAWDEARMTAVEQATRVGALVAVYTQHIERMRAFMADSLVHGDTTLPRDIALRLYTVEPGGNRFGGTFLRDPADAQEPPYGVVGASSLLANRAGTRSVADADDGELASALRLLGDLRVEFDTDAALSRSYYNSARLDFAVSFPAYPLEWTRASAAASGANSVDEFLVIRPAGSVLHRLGPEQNPQRALVWTDAYVDRGGAGTMVTIAAPVYARDVYYGAVATDVPLAALTRLLEKARSATGHIYVLTAQGSIIGTSDSMPTFELTQLASRVPPRLAAAITASRRGAADLITSDGWRALVTDVEGTPWRVVFAAPEGALAWSAAPTMLVFGVALLVLLMAACSGLWSFRQRFLRPAVSIFESAQANDEEALLARTRDTPWAPVADIVAQARAANRRSLARIEDEGRFKSAVFEASLDCIVTADEQGNVLDCNPALERIFGYSREQMIGRPMSETIVPPRHRASHDAGLRRYVATGHKRVLGKRIEIEGQHASGAILPLELTIAEAKVGAGRIFVAYIRDLTERKAVEAEMSRQRDALYQKEKMAALGSLLAGVSHELNNPLAVVVGRASMLEQDLEEPRLRDSVRRLRAAAERCGRIVRTFLAMARQSKPKRHAVDVATVLDAALEIAGYGLRSGGIHVTRQYATDLPRVLADEDQLAQVFMNLVVNAQHAMESTSGERQLTVRTRLVREVTEAKADGTLSVVVDVQDTGTGIPEDLRQRIFEPFFTTKKQGEGTGLGLAVSQGMIHAHGGRIEVASSSTGGTVFSVHLPVVAEPGPMGAAGARAPEAADGEAASSSAAIAAGVEQPAIVDSRPRALIIDEEAEVGSLLADMLDGYSCTVVESAREGLALLESERFDVILSDLRMPGMNGYEFAQALGRRRPELVERVIFVTGDTLGDLRAQVETLGRPVIDKPFAPEVLLEAVARVR